MCTFENDHKQELVQIDRKYHFFKKLFQFILHRFPSQILYLYLSPFPNRKTKPLTVTSKTWKHFIHSNCH